MKAVLKIVKILLITALTLALLLVAGVFALLKWPQLVVNERVFRSLSHLSGKFGAMVAWERADIRVQSKNLLHKRFDFVFEHFCFNLSENRRQGCFEKIELHAELAWLDRRFQAIQLGPILASGGNVALTLEPSKEQPKLELDVPPLVLPPWLRATRFGKILLELKSLTFRQQEDLLYSGSLSLVADPDDRSQLNAATLELESLAGAKAPVGNIQARLASASAFHENDWILTASSNLNAEPNLSANFELTLNPVEEKVYGLRLQGQARKGNTSAGLNLHATLGKGAFKGDFSGEGRGLPKPIQRLAANNCEFNLSEIVQFSDRLRFALDCPILVDTTPLLLPSPTFQKLVTIPYNLDMRVKTDLETSFYPSLDKPVQGNLELYLNTISQELLQVQGDTKTKFAGIPSRYPQGWTLETEMDVSALMPHFQKLVRALDRTAFAVFAPVNNLDGTVELKFTGKADIARQKGRLPLSFNTRLRSSEQSFESDGEGELQYQMGGKGTEAQLDMVLTLKDARLILPRFGYTAMPALFADPRFEKKAAEKKKDSQFKYQITVKTEKPAQLVSHLAKENIPLDLNLSLKPESLDGTVSVGQTHLEFFRRQALVQKFVFDLNEPREKSIVDGSVRVSYADYDIDILIVGTFKRPRIILQSEPPLDQEEILSVLIYGRTFDDLNTDNENSVSAVSSAVADRAMTLGSLFLLAGTPIESVSYDPVTNSFTAKVKIAQGTSLTVGTREGTSPQAGLRRSLGKNWILNTYVEDDQKAKAVRGGAMLEWHKRY